MFNVILITISIIGFFGNIQNIIVFCQKNMRKMITYRLLSYLSVIDLLVIIVCSSDVILSYGFKLQIRLYSKFACKMHTFLTYYFTHMSSLVLMLVSIERIIIIKGVSFSKTSAILGSLVVSLSAEKIILLIAIVIGFIDSHYLYFFELYQLDYIDFLNETAKNVSIEFNSSEVDNELKNIQSTLICHSLNIDYSYFLVNIWTWIDSSIYSFVPNTVMIICSILIFIEIRSKSNNLTSISKTNKSIVKNRVKRNKQIFYVLFATNIFFIICTLPYCITSYQPYDKKSSSLFTKTILVAHILSYSNNSFNFILYGVFSNQYRECLFNLFKSKKAHNSTVVTNDIKLSKIKTQQFLTINVNDHLSKSFNFSDYSKSHY
jgi:hypothetical protein